MKKEEFTSHMLGEFMCNVLGKGLSGVSVSGAGKDKKKRKRGGAGDHRGGGKRHKNACPKHEYESKEQQLKTDLEGLFDQYHEKLEQDQQFDECN